MVFGPCGWVFNGKLCRQDKRCKCAYRYNTRAACEQLDTSMLYVQGTHLVVIMVILYVIVFTVFVMVQSWPMAQCQIRLFSLRAVICVRGECKHHGELVNAPVYGQVSK